MSTADPNYSFTVNEQQGNYIINWNAAKLGFGVALPLLWPALGIGLFTAFMTADNSNFSFASFVTNFILGGLLFIVAVMLVFNLLIRRGGRFSFSKDGFEINGTRYPNKDIKGLYIKTPNGQREGLRVYTTAHGFGVEGAMHNVGQGIVAMGDVAGKAIRASIKKRSYKICIQYGEREIVLAKHLTAQTAKALLDRIDSLV